MQPKTPSDLDPKLKAAYERVMGTPIPTQTPPGAPAETPVQQAPPPTNPVQPEPNPVQEPQPQQTTTPPPDALPAQPEQAPQPPEPQPQPEMPAEEPATETNTPLPSADADMLGQAAQIFEPTDPFAGIENPPSNVVEKVEPDIAAAPKPKSKINSIFLVLGGLVFFVIYTVVWAKVFGLF